MEKICARGAPVRSKSAEQINSVINREKGSARKVFALYSSEPMLAPWEWFIPLVPYLREKDFFVVALATYDFPDALQEIVPCIFLESTDLSLLCSVDAFMCLDTDAGRFPWKSRVLAVSHGYQYNSEEISLPSAVRNMLHFDGYLVNFPLARSRSTIARHWQGLWPKALYQRHGERFDIFSCGYLRSAALYERLKSWHAAPDALCYAPTLRHHAPELGGDRMLAHARELLERLLSAFPEYAIIFRPFFSDIADTFIQEVAEAFKDNPRFIFDDAPDKFVTFCRSAAIVTDISHIANSFSYTTLRPTLAFRPWEARREFRLQPFGGIASTLEQLEQALRFFFRHRGRTVNHIRKERANGALPIENAFEEVAELLEAFVDDRPRTDLPDNWLSIARNGAESETNVAEMILRLFSAPVCSRFHLQQLAGREFLRGEPLFWAALLLEWRNAAPEAELILAAKSALKDLLPDDMPLPETYGESLAAARYLVRQRMRRLPDTGRAYYEELCRRLLDMCTESPGTAVR